MQVAGRLLPGARKVPLFTRLHAIPIVAGPIFIGACAAPFISSVVTRRAPKLRIVTVWEYARELPSSRVFSVCATSAGVLVAAAGVIALDIPGVHGPRFPQASRLLPTLVGALAIFVSGVGLDNEIFAHLVFAVAAFVAGFCFSALFVAVFAQLHLLEVRGLRVALLAVSGAALAALLGTWPCGDREPVGSMKSVAGFVVVLGFAVFVLSLTAKLRPYEIVLLAA